MLNFRRVGDYASLHGRKKKLRRAAKIVEEGLGKRFPGVLKNTWRV